MAPSTFPFGSRAVVGDLGSRKTNSAGSGFASKSTRDLPFAKPVAKDLDYDTGHLTNIVGSPSIFPIHSLSLAQNLA